MLPLAGFPFPVILFIINRASSSKASPFGAICTPPTTPSNGSLYQDSCSNSMLSCDPSTKSCQWRSCTVLGIPLGWDNATHAPPTPCHDDTFCPDSQLRCLPLQSIGSACDMGRDDECAGIQAICLNSVCTSKSAKLDDICGTESISLLSISTVRDNCTVGTYCSALNGIGVCQTSLSTGQGCLQDRQCASQQCQSSHCAANGTTPNNTLPAWQWAIIGVVLFLCLVTIVGILFVVKTRRQKQDLGELHFDSDHSKPTSFYQTQLQWWRRHKEDNASNMHMMHEQQQEKHVAEDYPYWHANNTTESYDTAITPTPSAFPIPPRRSPALWKQKRNIAAKAINKVNIRLSGTFTPTFGGSHHHHRKSKSPISPVHSPSLVYSVVNEEQELKIWQAVRAETPPWPVQGKGWKFARGTK